MSAKEPNDSRVATVRGASSLSGWDSDSGVTGSVGICSSSRVFIRPSSKTIGTFFIPLSPGGRRADLAKSVIFVRD